MPNSHEGRLASVEANIANMADGIGDVKDAVIALTDNQRECHQEVIQRLARLETMNIEFKQYQTDCDDERKEHRNRLDDVESFQDRQKGWVAAIAFTISAGVALASKWLMGTHT